MRSSAFAQTRSLVLIGSLVVVGVLVGLLVVQQKKSAQTADARPGQPSLIVYCAAGLKLPVDAVARKYQEEYHVPVQLQYAGSGTLLSNLRVAKLGDLFVAADRSYIETASKDGLIDEIMPLAKQHPVIAVKKGNPKSIHTLDDLLRPDVRYAMANPEQASIGRSIKKILTQSGQWETFQRQAKVMKPTVTDVANDIKIGSVDAGIIWNATAAQYPDLEAVEAPAFQEASETIMLAVLKSTRNPTATLRFARYLSAADRGLPEFAKCGMVPVRGDVWAETPKINLFSGAMLRPAIEKTVADFEKREGVQITTVYNGCGILCAQMRAGARPDAYFSCDTSFMNTVADLYLEPVDISSNDLVILVPKGNPMKIQTTADLTRAGLRLGLAHPDKSAMGALTKRLIEAQGIYDAVRANQKVDSATGDFLVNQLRTGSLDAIVACRSNAKSAAEYLDMIEIDHPLARAVQPYAVGRETKIPMLMTRLLNLIESKLSKDRFESAGFRWKAKDAAE